MGWALDENYSKGDKVDYTEPNKVKSELTELRKDLKELVTEWPSLGGPRLAKMLAKHGIITPEVDTSRLRAGDIVRTDFGDHGYQYELIMHMDQKWLVVGHYSDVSALQRTWLIEAKDIKEVVKQDLPTTHQAEVAKHQ